MGPGSKSVSTLLLVAGLACSACGLWLNSKSRQYGRLGEPIVHPETPLPPDEWFKQKLDHFNAAHKVFWNQRYQTNGSYYKVGGPVFLMIGGEGEISAKWMVSGAWIDYAKKYNALCFQLEHRFYGKSHPTEDMSVENLGTLNSEQALADLAWFIRGMNRKYKLPRETKWIAFGGSYPGSLAAWLRYKYPHLVYGAISSSGPLLAKADFSEYFDVVKANLVKESGYLCADTISQAYASIYNKWRNVNERSLLQGIFNLCDPLGDDVLDFTNLNSELSDNIAEVVQYNKDNRASSLNITITNICDILTNPSNGGSLKRFAVLNDFIAERSGRECLDYKYDKMIKTYQNTSWEGEDAASRTAARSWYYQTCTEFGFYQTSENPQNLLGSSLPLEFYQKMCTDIYGSEFNEHLLHEAIDETNTMYGALSLIVDHVVFVHGTVDPWHALGMMKKSYPGAKVIVIKGTAHCANMYAPSENDSQELKQARVEISEVLGSWLSEGHRLNSESS
ncbi:unnamed protein product [Bemisia tabaci]|uniref:Serine protease K12H4.7 n=1 Tax=Bemisia tabaci TaxID=7038 RepID=A0A9P0CB48_BEMTA|nr:unnamed protein product [Bemisia tabaci]